MGGERRGAWSGGWNFRKVFWDFPLGRQESGMATSRETGEIEEPTPGLEGIEAARGYRLCDCHWKE